MAVKRGVLAAIRQSDATLERVQIGYAPVTGGHVTREVRPYEIKRKRGHRYLYATDTLHGAGQIHSFRLDRITSARPVDGSQFRPVWPVDL